MEIKEAEFEEIRVSISSMRLDNFVAKVIRTSRGKASELLKDGKVFVNTKTETKDTKVVCKDDVIVIRGYGKFLVYEITFDNKKGKNFVIVKKYK